MSIGPRGSVTIRPPDAYLDAAAKWPVILVSRETEPGHHHVEVSHLERAGLPLMQHHLCCMPCGQSVAILSPDADGPGYAVNAGQIAAGVLAHLKTCHEDALPLT